ncbi:MAG: triose-phosphate isomerase [Rhodospirillaceae bacterium]|nr:triose-phosphate isomerase [Rhodospirillaceae bacterium]
MAPFWVGTGWKMNHTRADAAAYAATLRASPLPRAPGLQLFVCPPFTALATVADGLGDCPVKVAAQNIHWAAAGAHTGEISAAMVADCGATMAELGHSERRHDIGETDEEIGRKVRAALDAGLIALLCVGETRLERRAGAAIEATVRQLKLGLGDVAADELKRCLVAYEPVWAIGEGGVPCSPADAASVHAALRAAMAEKAGAVGVVPPVLYGGSVNLENCRALAAEPEIDGLFVGRAAWQAEGLLAVAEAALEVRRQRTA